jgi:hypothetical protein
VQGLLEQSTDDVLTANFGCDDTGTMLYAAMYKGHDKDNFNPGLNLRHLGLTSNRI